MEIKVSIIIPVYNVEKTLSRCIESILNQTMKDLEIILINDGSPDKSAIICDDYASRYANIRVIHKENEGLGPTRNIGSKIAIGEYIYHCDSDDWVEPTMLQDVYLNAKSNEADAVIFGYRLLTEENNTFKEFGTVTSNSDKLISKKAIQKYFIQNLNNAYFTQSACNRLIKRNFLEKNQIEFKDFRRSQDVIFSLDLFDKLERLNIISDVYYNYIIEPGKFKGRSFDEMINIYLEVYEELKNHFLKWGLLDASYTKSLQTLYISKISNYASFYIIKKSGYSKLNIINKLLSNERVQKLYNSIYPNNITSRFLRNTHSAIIHKRRIVLLLIFWVHQIKQKI